MRKTVAKKLTPAVKNLLQRAEMMEREAGLLYQLASLTAQVEAYKARYTAARRGNTKRTKIPTPYTSDFNN